MPLDRSLDEKCETISHPKRSKAIFVIGALALVLVGMWKWSPLAEYADAEVVLTIGLQLKHSAWAPVVIIGVYIVSGFVAFPVTALNLATIIGLGGVYGFSVAMVGTIAAAYCFFLIGRWYGSEALTQLNNDHVDTVAEMVRNNGVIAVALTRMLPLAPFPVINAVTGACGVGSWIYLVGTILGEIPGLALIAIFSRQLRLAFQDPGIGSYTLLAVAVLIMLAVGYWAKLKTQKRRAAKNV